MNTTTASPKRALILVDVQNEYVTGNLPIEFPPLDVSLPNIARAISAAQDAKIPLVVVQQMAPSNAPIFAEGSSGWELHPIVTTFQPDLLVQKKLPSALAGTALAEWLRARQIDTLVVAGYMSQNCNESTILHAAHAGWAVEYLHDAAGAVSYRNDMGLLTARAMHEASCIVLQSRFAAVMSTSEWIELIGSGEAASRDSLYASYLRASAAKAE
ncbi:cysteine hydrolase family protein [Zoogloea sp.]|uniref:cysteine hydrolase family protein n=1 Tax=Zoogloea sp. TaxID=49181 RepID=UPI0035AFF14C